MDVAATPEDGIATNSHTAVLADREACFIQAAGLENGVELKLMVGDDFSLAMDLIGHDTAFECYDRNGLADNATLE